MFLNYFNLFAHDTSKDEAKTKVKYFLYNKVENNEVLKHLDKMENYNDLCYKKIAILYYKEKVTINNIALRLNYSPSNIKKMLGEINLSVYSHFIEEEQIN